MTELPFWKRKKLEEMTSQEWESLCDGCAQCCLLKFEDVDTGDLATTNIACVMLDCESCRCTDYPNRSLRVPDCVSLTPENIADIDWMPQTCAYRLLKEGRDLYDWHPLVSGTQESVHLAGMSVREVAIPEEEMVFDDPEDYITGWIRK